MTPALHFTQFGKYEIIRKLGRSMTDVYLALDPEANRRVVLKIVEQCRDPYTQLVVDAERRGSMIQQQLHSIDGRILEVYECGEKNGCFFVAMQYAEGKSLAEMLQRDSRLDPMKAARYAAEVASQLHTLHSFQTDIDGQKRAVVHGDIKPSNIQVGSDGEVWLLDFGIAKFISATRNLTHHNLGSPAYCSPERIARGQVDPSADLWSLGVCLYEMVAGMPPYQAQTTRKLENLIQSRRPPRALPDSCPAALKSVIWKALSGDTERRYQTATEFEADLRALLGRKVTSAEVERQPAWDANATLEKARPTALTLRPKVKRRFPAFIAQFNVLMWSLTAGLIVGLICFVPASYLYRFWTHSAPLRVGRDYTRVAAAEIESDWQLYQGLKQQYGTLGRFSPVPGIAKTLRQRLMAASDAVIERYRNSSNPSLEHFDWDRARVCLQHALELDGGDSEAKGKLLLVEGYQKLLRDPKEGEAAKRNFEEATALLPSAPDPRLALARVDVYSLHNIGLAMADFRAAERLGFKAGPREFEQQADGYLYRAEQTLRLWKRAVTPVEQRRLLTAAQRDFERARDLYEPIAGFSNVSQSLEQLSESEGAAEKEQVERDRARAAAAKGRRSRYARWR